MKLEVVRIPAGGIELAGLRYRPEGAERATALIYAHGFTAGKYSLDTLAGYLAGKGYEGLTFDFVGHKLGASGGEMWHVEQTVDNVRSALAWLRQHSSAQNVVLAGHSMGAAAVLNTAVKERQAHVLPEQARLAGLVCMCIGTEPARGFQSALGQAMLAQRSDYVAGAPAASLIAEVDSLVGEASQVGELPALFLAARQDVIVSPERVAALAALIGPSAQFDILNTSHLEAPDRARTAFLQWLEAQKL